MLIQRGNRIFGPILAANLLLWIVSLSTCIATEVRGEARVITCKPPTARRTQRDDGFSKCLAVSLVASATSFEHHPLCSSNLRASLHPRPAFRRSLPVKQFPSAAKPASANEGLRGPCPLMQSLALESV